VALPLLGNPGWRRRALIGILGTFAVLSVLALVGFLISQPWSAPSSSEQAALRTYLNDLRPAFESNLEATRTLATLPEDAAPEDVAAACERAAAEYQHAVVCLRRARIPQALVEAHAGFTAVYDRGRAITARDAAVLRELLTGTLSNEEMDRRVAEVERLDAEFAGLPRDARSVRYLRDLAEELVHKRIDQPEWFRALTEEMQELREGAATPEP
jgi:hypothetical protein